MSSVQTMEAPKNNMTAQISKTWKIINQTDADIVAIDAFTNEQISAKQLYGQSLQTLETTDGKTVVSKGATQTLALKEVHKDAAGNVLDYTIIIAKATDLSPIKTVGLSMENDPASFAALTITKSDVENAKLAEKFQQLITAFPSSTLATDFATALADSDADQISGFFKNSEDFKMLTLDMVVAIQTYYTRYPFWLTGGTGTKSFSLYTSDGETNTHLGAIELENESVSPLNTTNALAKFTIIYTNAHGTDSELYYADGQFVDDEKSTSPSVCLQGLFVLKSQITKLETDNTIVAILTGTIGTNQVFGYAKDGVLLQSSDDSSALDVLLHPDDTKSWLELIGIIVGGVIGLVVLGITAKCIIDAIKNKKLTPEERAAKNLEIRDKNRANTQEILDRMSGKKLKVPKDVNESLREIKKQANDQLLKENKSKMLDMIDKQQAMYDKITSFENPQSMQNVYDRISEVYEKLIDSSSYELGGSMEGMVAKLKLNSKTLVQELGNVKKNLNVDEKKAMDDAKEAIDNITKEVDKNEEIRDDLAKDEIPEIIEE